MEITFPGGVVVEARHESFTIRTDQPEADGGGNSAPAPFALFLASLGTCAGFYALTFCQQRQIDTTGLKLNLTWERDNELHRLSRIGLAVTLPEGFPPKYRQAILKAIDQCTVKRTILAPPEFTVSVV
ncbi:MAG: osmotically inducible protein OsmC [Desulfuromonadaceae bacterium GWC2_58_13]|nr:MAG: osmotically inducible protein OsmC [Desulfuromonadaceae bacterium GWC2_58_13]